MANKELLETIRKEIVSRIDKRHLSEQAKNELVSILSFLSDLEIEEKPTTAEGLEEEIERYLSTEWELDEDLNKDEPIYIYDCTWEDLKIFVRHFAQWGAEHLKK